ncbi:MAG: hypothetical protein J6B06_06270 [Lachnospiraceae bacterium]|nr:hypothetical protein [Lachnospiraceae bacterium]
MVYKSGRLELVSIREVFCSSVNDVVICKDRNAVPEIYYTLLIIKEHEVAKRLLQIYESAGPECRKSYIECFASGQQFYMVFPYQKERPLESFYMETEYSLNTCEAICMNLIVQCIAARLPYPLLYLVLTQKQIHIAADNTIYFSYQFHLDELDESRTEAHCASVCAMMMISLLEKKSAGKLVSYQLLKKKGMHGDYGTLTDLYRDARMSALREENVGILGNGKRLFKKYQHIVLKLLLVICIAMGITALIMILSQLVLGDIPLMRIFVNTFKKIGTESLLQ